MVPLNSRVILGDFRVMIGVQEGDREELLQCLVGSFKRRDQVFLSDEMESCVAE